MDNMENNKINEEELDQVSGGVADPFTNMFGSLDKYNVGDLVYFSVGCESRLGEIVEKQYGLIGLYAVRDIDNPSSKLYRFREQDLTPA